jgi:anti-sigma factor RsiW
MRLTRLRRRALACQEVVELVTAYLDDALPPKRRALVQAHLDACEHCTTYLDQIRVTIASVGHLPLDGLSDEAYDALAEAFRDVL